MWFSCSFSLTRWPVLPFAEILPWEDVVYYISAAGVGVVPQRVYSISEEVLAEKRAKGLQLYETSLGSVEVAVQVGAAVALLFSPVRLVLEDCA